jgi:hypothetical protein
MKHINTFESFLYEGFMSSLDLIAQDAKNLEDFKKKAKRDFPQIAKLDGADEWLEEIYSQAIKESVNEGVDVNDPILVAMRAAREDRKKNAAAQKERMKKRVYGKQREKLEDELWDIAQDLKDAYADRRELYNDMEAAAGEKGDAWSDDDANQYGKALNAVDDNIEKLIKKRQEIEIKLAY